MSKTGAAEPAKAHSPNDTLGTPLTNPAAAPVLGAKEAPFDSSPDDFFVPDLCSTPMVFTIVLVAELVALTLTLARPTPDFFIELARVSLFLQWVGLTSAAVICYARQYLARLSIPGSAAWVFGLLMLNTALISELALRFGMDTELTRGAAAVAAQRWPFLLRNEGICVIVTALLLRYFFVTHQWQLQVRAEARSRIQALQARIRPHFLFNSMNTIAALTRTDPLRAELAVEDLADLFRASLRDSHRPIRLEEELELSYTYQRIEALRLGERLRVLWDVTELPMKAFIPSLTIQPLLENAIRHGIERLERGGTVTVAGRVVSGDIEIVVTNPVAPTDAADAPHGNRLALANIRERLDLAYGSRCSVAIDRTPDYYRVTVRFPHAE